MRGGEEEFLEGWDEERADIIDDTLGELRDQRDAKQEITDKGRFVLNPAAFNTGPTFIIGPIMFASAFDAEPVITFGQTTAMADVALPVAASGYTTVPFLVMPFVRSLHYTNNQVDGFFLGLYAISGVPEGVTQHTVSWKATGEGSAYSEDFLSESWTEEYDYNEPDYFIEEAVSDDDF